MLELLPLLALLVYVDVNGWHATADKLFGL